MVFHVKPAPDTPSTPDAARRVFSSRLALAERYVDLLATDGVVRGLIGPREVPRLWERHLVNCALLGKAIPEGLEVCDVGTGAEDLPRGAGEHVAERGAVVARALVANSAADALARDAAGDLGGLLTSVLWAPVVALPWPSRVGVRWQGHP